MLYTGQAAPGNPLQINQKYLLKYMIYSDLPKPNTINYNGFGTSQDLNYYIFGPEGGKDSQGNPLNLAIQ